MKHLQLRKIKKINHNSSTTVQVTLADLDIYAEADSGAEVNVMDEFQHRAILHRSKEDVTLRPSNVKLKTVKEAMKVMGEFHTIVRNETRGARARFIVVEGHIDSKPLLSKETLEDLGMIKIAQDGSLREENDLKIDPELRRIKRISTIEEIKHRHRGVFEGIGEIRDIKGNRSMEVHLDIEEDTRPVAQKPRHVPYYLMDPLKEWLDVGVQEGIFEAVPPGEPISWCSPLVVQPKPKFKGQEKLTYQQIRASIDMRIVNEAMKRTRIVQAPVVEDFTSQLNDCKVFSKLDLRQGYHQLPLDAESSKLATFSTPWGNFRPHRLVFGGNPPKTSLMMSCTGSLAAYLDA